MKAVVDLRGRPSWAPASLLAPAPELAWPPGCLLAPLGELTEPVRPTADRSDAPVVTPSSVDPATWAITATRRKSSGSAVSAFGPKGLRAGDLLVPPAYGPVLLVDDDYAGFVFSGSYLPLRVAASDALWLWGVLNTRRGADLRLAVARQTTATRLTAGLLAGLPVPLPPVDWAERRNPVERLHAGIAMTTAAAEVGQSWWRTAALPRAGTWSPYLSTREPERLEEGTPLAKLADEVRSGVRVERTADEPLTGWLPYLTSRDVRAGLGPSVWTDDARLIAEPGDLVVADVGARGEALAVTETVVPGTGLLLARLGSPERAAAIAAYINSGPGQAIRRLLVTGSHIPHLGLGGLRRLPVPTDVLDGQLFEAVEPSHPHHRLLTVDEPGRPAVGPNSLSIPELLERLLWS